MTERERRRFLQQSAALVGGIATGSCRTPAEPPASSPRELERTTLEAIGHIVLPAKALGDDGIAHVLDEFQTWLAELEPVAELDHPYLWTDEIAYGPPDPAPLWKSQLEALELEASKRFATSFPELGGDAQRAMLDRSLPRFYDSELPYAGDAPHVAIGLVAYFYRTSRANDLGYGAAIEKQTCRGLDTGPDEPTPLGD